MSQGGTPRPPGGRPLVAPRPRLTGRAAILVIVMCGIALTLAYPVREYIADRRQIDQLVVQNEQMAATVRHLREQLRASATPARIEQQARDSLHMCFPSQTCYEIIYPARPHASGASRHAAAPWYGRLWKSVVAADATSPR